MAPPWSAVSTASTPPQEVVGNGRALRENELVMGGIDGDEVSEGPADVDGDSELPPSVVRGHRASRPRAQSSRIPTARIGEPAAGTSFSGNPKKSNRLLTTSLRLLRFSKWVIRCSAQAACVL